VMLSLCVCGCGLRRDVCILLGVCANSGAEKEKSIGEENMDRIKFALLSAGLGIALAFTLAACGGGSSSSQQSSVIYGASVLHGNETYETVVIGTQTWFKRNLSYDASGSKCYGEGVSGVSADSIAKNCAKYGRLYDWATAMGIDTLFNSNLYPGSAIIKVKGLCPAGWHLPDNNYEWQSLMILIGGKKTDGTKLKATSGWKDYGQYMPGCIWIGEDNRSCNIQVSGNGTDDYGFSALPGGMGYYSDYYRSYNYNSIEEYGYWWTSTGYSGDAQSAHYWDINYSNIYDNIYGSSSDKRQLFSIRCVKD